MFPSLSSYENPKLFICPSDDCDGSVDLQFPANRGLEDIKAWLDVEYEEYGDGLSKADFLQLCGIVAIEHGIDYYNGNSTECMLFGTNCIPKVRLWYAFTLLLNSE